MAPNMSSEELAQIFMLHAKERDSMTRAAFCTFLKDKVRWFAAMEAIPAELTLQYDSYALTTWMNYFGDWLRLSGRFVHIAAGSALAPPATVHRHHPYLNQTHREAGQTPSQGATATATVAPGAPKTETMQLAMLFKRHQRAIAKNPRAAAKAFVAKVSVWGDALRSCIVLISNSTGADVSSPDNTLKRPGSGSSRRGKTIRRHSRRYGRDCVGPARRAWGGRTTPSDQSRRRWRRQLRPLACRPRRSSRVTTHL
jgi:hypothetical protein